MYDEFLVPFDGSPETVHSGEVAAGLAKRCNAKVRLLVDFGRYQEGWEDRVSELEERTGLTFDISMIEPHHFLSDELLEELDVHPNSIVCKDSFGRGRLALLAGSDTTDTLVYLRAPIILVGPECRTDSSRDGRMLIAVDGSTESEAVIPAAIEAGGWLSFPPHVISVLDPDANQLPDGAGDVQESAYVSRIASQLGVDVPSFDVLHGKPSKEIIREGAHDEVAMVAMASEVPLGIDRLIHGSTLDDVVQHSKVPVLAVNCRIGVTP